MAKPNESADHRFDRRITDGNVAALSVRVTALEDRVETVEHKVETTNRELIANTALTRQVHEMAERTEVNTAVVVEATKWLSTTKKLVIVIFASVTGACGAIIAAVQAMKAMGVM